MSNYEKLVQYVNTASNLADSAKNDIATNGYYSDTTVIALNEFIKASHAMSDIVDFVNQKVLKLN